MADLRLTGGGPPDCRRDRAGSTSRTIAMCCASKVLSAASTYRASTREGRLPIMPAAEVDAVERDKAGVAVVDPEWSKLGWRTGQNPIRSPNSMPTSAERSHVPGTVDGMYHGSNHPIDSAMGVFRKSGGALVTMKVANRSAGTRLQIVLAADVRIGPGKADLLHGIKDTGSIAAAGRHIGMSYKRAWYLVEAMNSHFDRPLVEASKGGKSGGGARLTQLGEDVLNAYREMQAETDKAVAPVLRRLRRKIAIDISN